MDKLDSENGSNMKGLIVIVAAILAFILLFVGKYMFPDVDAVIKEMVKGSNDAFTQLNNPNIIEARSYRDGDKKGVVLEFTYSKWRSEQAINEVEKRKELLKSLKRENLDKVLSYGIYYKVIYKDYKSRNLLEIIINAEDLSE